MRNEFYKENPSDKIWIYVKDDLKRGRFDFSFDKKTIYDFWSEWDKLTGEQQDMVAAEFPEMAQLKGYPYSRKQD